MISANLQSVADPSSKSIKIDFDLWKKIKVIITARNNEKIQDFVNEVLRPVVDKEYPKALKKLGADQEK